jgi:uroporphyrinogen decarboxylase
MVEEEMTPKERWLSVLRGREPDRVPMDYWATDEVTDILKQHLGCRNLREMYERLHIDVVISVEPEYVGPPISEDADVFGCRYRNVEYGTGVYRECVYHPLAQYETLKEIERSYS